MDMYPMPFFFFFGGGDPFYFGGLRKALFLTIKHLVSFYIISNLAFFTHILNYPCVKVSRDYQRYFHSVVL